MRELIEYILAHTERGECQCGRCIDKAVDRPTPEHSVNVHFFWVSLKGEASQDALRALLEAHYPDLERLRGGPSYIELGGVLGDQQVALRLIGLGDLVGLWRAITPRRLGASEEEASNLAGMGLVNAGIWEKKDSPLAGGLVDRSREPTSGVKAASRKEVTDGLTRASAHENTSVETQEAPVTQPPVEAGASQKRREA